MNSSFSFQLRPVQLESLPTSGAASSWFFLPRHVARLARRLAHLGGLDRLFDDAGGDFLIFEVVQVQRELFQANGLDDGADFRVAQPALGLALELRLLHAGVDHGGHALAEVLAGEVVVPSP